MTPGDENVMLYVVCQYVVSLDREVYLSGKGSDVHEEIISKGSFNISVWHLVVFLIQYCCHKQKEFLMNQVVSAGSKKSVLDFIKASLLDCRRDVGSSERVRGMKH
jgi:hypothetical protein